MSHMSLSNVHRNLFFFAALFSAAVALDGVKFLAIGKPTVIDWESFVHPLWVVIAAVVLLSASFSRLVQRIAFWVYLTIFAASYINVYIAFTEVLTYFCMLFNLVLTALFFFVTRTS